MAKMCQCECAVKIHSAMCHENVARNTFVFTYYSEVEGIYYQAKDPVTKADLTEFSPGPINHVLCEEPSP